MSSERRSNGCSSCAKRRQTSVTMSTAAGMQPNLSAEARAQRVDAAHVLLRLGVEATALHGALALVVGSDRRVLVAAEVVQQLAQVEHAAADVVVRRVRVERIAAGKRLVH